VACRRQVALLELLLGPVQRSEHPIDRVIVEIQRVVAPVVAHAGGPGPGQ
jgi:hypothetical protein